MNFVLGKFGAGAAAGASQPAGAMGGSFGTPSVTQPNVAQNNNTLGNASISVPIGALDSRLGCGAFTKDFILSLAGGANSGSSYGEITGENFYSRFGFMPLATNPESYESQGFLDPVVLTSLRHRSIDSFRKSLAQGSGNEKINSATGAVEEAKSTQGAMNSAASILAGDLAMGANATSLNRSIYEPALGVTTGGIGGASMYAIRHIINTASGAGDAGSLKETTGQPAPAIAASTANVQRFLQHAIPRYLRDLNAYQHDCLVQSSRLLTAMVIEGPVEVARAFVSLYNRRNIYCPFRYVFYNFYDPNDPRCIVGEFTENYGASTSGAQQSGMSRPNTIGGFTNRPAGPSFSTVAPKISLGSSAGGFSSFGAAPLTNAPSNTFGQQQQASNPNAPLDWFRKIVVSPTGALVMPEEPPPGWDKNMWTVALVNNPDPNRRVPTLASTFADLRIRQMTQKYEMKAADYMVQTLKARIEKLKERKEAFLQTCKLAKVTQSSIQERLIGLTCAVQNTNLEAVPAALQTAAEVDRIAHSRIYPIQDAFVRAKIFANESRKDVSVLKANSKPFTQADLQGIRNHLSQQKEILMRMIKKIEAY